MLREKRIAPVPLRFLLAWCLLLSPIAAANAQSPGAAKSPAVRKGFLTPETVVALSLAPKQVLTNPSLSMLPIEVAEAASEKYLGMPASSIVRAVAVGEPPMGMNLFYAVFLHADQPWDLEKLAPELTAHTQPGQVAGRDCLVSQVPSLPCLMVVKKKTLVAAPQMMLEKLFSKDRPEAEGVLADLVGARPAGDDLYLAVDLEKLRPFIQLGLMQASSEVPPEFAQYLQIPMMLQSAELAVNLPGARPSSLLAAHAADESQAQQVEQLLAQGFEQAKAILEAQSQEALEKMRSSENRVERAMAAYADRMSEQLTDSILPKREGQSFVLFDTDGLRGEELASVAVIGVLVGLLLPAVQAAREAARRNQSSTNMKLITLSLHNYEATRGALPAHAIYSKDGKPLLSWRVALLPFLDEDLYNRFHLDEPWDSEHNRQLIPLMPAIFLDQGSALTAEQGKTSYLAVEGPQGFVSGTAQPRKFRQFTDGLSYSVAIVQVDDATAVTWTKPEDWKHDPQNPKQGLGGLHPGIWVTGMADGSVQSFSTEIDRETWNAFLTINGGEPLGRLVP